MAQPLDVVSTDRPAVQIAGSFGRLLYVNATGALVQVHKTLTEDRECRLCVRLEPEPVELQVRVVRSKAVPVRLAGATWQRQEHVVVLAFTELSANAQSALRPFYGDGFDQG